LQLPPDAHAFSVFVVCRRGKSVCSTAASVSDVHMLPGLLHGGKNDSKRTLKNAGLRPCRKIRGSSLHNQAFFRASLNCPCFRFPAQFRFAALFAVRTARNSILVQGLR
jgi:hypothetical protein